MTSTNTQSIEAENCLFPRSRIVSRITVDTERYNKLFLRGRRVKANCISSGETRVQRNDHTRRPMCLKIKCPWRS